MLIGILTASRTNNNGTDLQTAAMYNLFSKTGNEVEIIDYACRKLENSRRLLCPLSIKNIIRLPWKVYDHFARQSFRRKAYVKSPTLYYPDTLVLDKYDFVVVGSDQIWNLKITGEDLNFFLPAKTDCKQKMSYAASIGKTDIREWDNQLHLKEYLKEFLYVSVREQSGVSALSKIGITATQDLDPILFLEESEWDRLKTKKQRRKQYVLLYLVQECPQAVRAAIRYARENNLDVIRIGNLNKPLRGVKTKSFVNIGQWIGLMDDASMVFTNSYHGLSTAIGLKTNVRVFPLKEKESNTRAVCLLESLNMQPCFVRNDFRENQYWIPNWMEIDSRLEELKKRSMLNIKTILNMSRGRCEDA